MHFSDCLTLIPNAVKNSSDCISCIDAGRRNILKGTESPRCQSCHHTCTGRKTERTRRHRPFKKGAFRSKTIQIRSMDYSIAICSQSIITLLISTNQKNIRSPFHILTPSSLMSRLRRLHIFVARKTKRQQGQSKRKTLPALCSILSQPGHQSTSAKPVKLDSSGCY